LKVAGGEDIRVMESIQCYNTGCGTKYDPSKNSEGKCFSDKLNQKIRLICDDFYV